MIQRSHGLHAPSALLPRRLRVVTVLAFLSAGCMQPEPVGLDDEPVAALVTTAASFTEVRIAPYGTFRGTAYVRYSGRVEGTTSLGAFRVPFEVIVPADTRRANGTLVFEPPHFAFGAFGRDVVIGHDRLFGAGFSYASVGFGANGLNILDPTATDVVIIKGEPVLSPGEIMFGVPPDEEILIQFLAALGTTPWADGPLVPIVRRYAYGISQTASALLEMMHAPGGVGQFDLTLLHLAIWKAPFAAGEFERIEGEFTPLDDVGRVIIVNSEGDIVIGESEQLRRATERPDYRVYEVAGAAHVPTASNPLDHQTVARALFVAGDQWVRRGVAPPPSRLLEEAAPGTPDPVYPFPTGIARDDDGNALGGVRLPDLHVGRASYIAVDLSASGLPLTGTSVDLACSFRNHGEYVSGFTRQSGELRREGFLLPRDAAALNEMAAASGVRTQRC